jgi:hypothetical protein
LSTKLDRVHVKHWRQAISTWICWELSKKKGNYGGQPSRLTLNPVLHASVLEGHGLHQHWGRLPRPQNVHREPTLRLLYISSDREKLLSFIIQNTIQVHSCDSFDAAGFRNSEQPSCGSTDTRCRQQVHLVIKRCANQISFKRSERAMAHYCYSFVE